MPNDAAFGDEAALVMPGLVRRTEEGMGAAVVPEPDADLGVGWELGSFHLDVLHTRSGL